MAKAAVFKSSSSNNFPFGRVQSDVAMKRKTPSELRGEQLKRRNGETHADEQLAPLLAVNVCQGEQLKRRNGETHADEQLAPLLASDRITFGAINGIKKPESSKVPKYISTRVDEVYPVKKSSERRRVLYGKESARDLRTISNMSNDFIDSSVTSSFPAGGKSLLSCGKADSLNILECSDSSAKEIGEQGFQKIEKCSQNALRNVVELHLGNVKPSNSAEVDMQKVLKGLVARDVPATSGSLADSSGNIPSISSSSFCSEFHIPGNRIPLDFTLKTTLQLVSSSSVKWCHRLSASPATILDLGQFTSQFCCNKNQKFGCTSELSVSAEIMYSEALHSWVYPQSSLPASIISALALSAVTGEKEFLSRRQQDWEDSFRNLYYMLRKNMCNIFYVCTTQFVVLFIGGNFLGEKRSCNAYLSKSTRGFRSLLKKNDISFSMPLCHVEVEQAAEDDLVELSEIEKRNLGQTIHRDSMSDADNSPQSLLAFIGNKNVHGLYDFLLNYRFFLYSFIGVDVPVLYAPVPFQHASLSVPEVRCKEMKRADAVLPSSSGSDTENTEAPLGLSASGICYSIEIEDTILPPWIVSGVCVAMRSEGKSFESIFTTEPLSIGLNIALDSVCQKSDLLTVSSKSLPESVDAFDIPEAAPSPFLRLASLRCLKYSKGSYVSYATPV